jgi:chaperone required for assembly of F1-ATPase
MRRLYREVTVEVCADGLQILLDDKPLRTPAKAALVLPTRMLAEAIAAEWRAQTIEIKPQSMPLTQLAATAIDRVRPRRAKIIDEVAAYAGTDLLCYRATEPRELAAQQRAIWQPQLDWLNQRYGASLAVTEGVRPIAQSEAALDRLRAVVAAQDDLHLTALHALTGTFGSLALALAVLDRQLAAADALAASQLDETYQMERWGADREAVLRREVIRGDVAVIAQFIELLRV